MVKDKVAICSSELSKFTALEGVGGYPLYKRYDALRNILQSEVGEQYEHFISHPVENADAVITWYCTPYKETPRHLEDMTGEERTRYESIRNTTIEHYNQVIANLQSQNKWIEHEFISKAIKSIDERFIYCFDDKVVLAIWGMKPRNNKSMVSGEYARDLFIATPKDPVEPEILNEPVIEQPVPILPPVEMPNPENHKVSFSAGEHGTLKGNSLLELSPGESVKEPDIPQVEAKKGYRFKGWDKNPSGYQTTGDTEFVAQYEKIERRPWYWWIWGLWGNRWLRWLLWLLLLLLLIWLVSLFWPPCNGSNDVGGVPVADSLSNDDGSGDNNGRNGNGSGDENGDGGNNTDIGNGDGVRDGDGDGAGIGYGAGTGVLPAKPRLEAPIDSSQFGYGKDSIAKIVKDRLNILIDGDASVLQFAKDFKAAYPSDAYQVVYYDTLIKRLQIKIPPEEREALKQKLPEQFKKYNLFIWDETLFESFLQLNDPALQDKNKSWHIDACLVQQAWDYTLGNPDLIIAIVDESFDLKHSEFAGKIVKPYNVWTKSNEIFSSVKKHGTHVAGIALAIGNNGAGIAGIAPNCRFMPVQVADKAGHMTITSAVDGILYAIYSGADVINVSLGMSFSEKAENWSTGMQGDLVRNHFKEEEKLWKEVFRIAGKRNVTIVLAAGNENILAGIDPVHRPSQAITVSAVDKANRPYAKSRFSNFGEHSTVSAPGIQIYSTFGANGYKYLSGTSMAAPIVTGAVALLKSIDSTLTTESIKQILISTGIPISGSVGNMIQLGKAMKAAAKNRKDLPHDCNTIAREIDSLKKEIEKRLRICPELNKQ